MKTHRRTLSKKRPKPDKPVAGPDMQGEGNYEAARRYNSDTRDFIESGRVHEAARDAAPRDPAEAESIEEAEQAGKARSKGEDPAVAAKQPRARAKRP
jgi:hypothetical protein